MNKINRIIVASLKTRNPLFNQVKFLSSCTRKYTTRHSLLNRPALFSLFSRHMSSTPP